MIFSTLGTYRVYDSISVRVIVNPKSKTSVTMSFLILSHLVHRLILLYWLYIKLTTRIPPSCSKIN